MKRRCEICAFAVSIARTPGFYCHRYPPQVTVYPHVEQGAVFEQHYPYVEPNEWCGEFKEGGR